MGLTILCDIVSVQEAIFSGKVKMIIAHGYMGDLGISPGHAALLTNLKPGPVRLIKTSGPPEIYYISGGFLEVQPKIVKILADTAIRGTDLDECAAEESLKAAKKALQKSSNEFDYISAASALAEAAAQLRTLNQLKNKFHR